MKADLAIFAKVYREDGSEAEACAVKDDRIIAVGSAKEISILVEESTEVIYAPGSALLPGFTDGHAHISFAKKVFNGIDLSDKKTEEECRKEIREFKANHPNLKFVYGQGYSVDCFGEKGKLKNILDELYPDTPVLIESDGCHSVWVNEEFIRQNLSGDISFLPSGGVWKKDDGSLLGFFCEAAADKVLDLMPETTIEDYKKAFLDFQERVLPLGIQMVQEPICYCCFHEIQKIVKAFRELDNERKLLLRVKANIKCKPEDNEDEVLDYIEKERANPGYHFEVQGMKLFMDGVVEERTALLLEDYADKPGFKGEGLWDQERLDKLVLKTRLRGIPVHVHTMGDGATEMIIKALENAANSTGIRNLRDTFTHLQVLNEDQCGRIAALGVTACVNTYWHFHEHSYYATKDLPYLGKERAEAEYRVKSLLDKGVVLSQGSDWPVSNPPNPLEGVEIGVTRRMPGNLTSSPMTPSEKVDIKDMLKAVTYGGAYQLELERETGSIATGKLANMILLEEDPTECEPSEIHSIRILNSWIDGKQVS